MMELSKRLQAVAGLVEECTAVADVGTDHGYIPIFLIESGKCRKAIAMDINQGPLLRARDHIKDHGLEDQIQVRQSDGVLALQAGECDCIILSGMGGNLIVRILSEGMELFRSAKECILQPQSELEKVRAYLEKEGFRIAEEDMVLEEGKFYPMMKVIRGKEAPYSRMELRYGRVLLRKRHPLLKAFLEREVSTQEEILGCLKETATERGQIRRIEVKENLSLAKEALTLWE